ncbi:MAG: bifunctional DNA-formamidopyrimidine glycosylase/DNA-(apurinic or apyrimidinic site) lyase [Rickettsiales bacterium]|nr:bifunctional DNA-formamidopyrimidine glycosylase/DNA-(apurinic or apyrimidinic site) lyase [Rickettsiales bacterium]
MPELPEVETIKNGIQEIKSKKIINTFSSSKKLRFDSHINLEQLKNLQIKEIIRRARYLIITLNNNKSLIIHLGMSGKISLKDSFSQEKHDHFAIQFQDNSWLIYNDARRFGFVDLINSNEIKKHKMLKDLGPEPLSEEFNSNYLYESLKNKSTNIKTTMMDNKLVVGVGNIYINESLFDAKILPTKQAKNLTKKEIDRLIKSIKKIISHAIELGGSSISDYVTTRGEMGNFQDTFKVYGRADKKNQEKCLICDNKIKKIVQNGRSTFYCDNCQK